MSEPNMHPNFTPEETRAKMQNLERKVRAKFSGPEQAAIIKSEIFTADPADPRTHLRVSGASAIVTGLEDSLVVQYGEKQIEASDRSRRANKAVGEKNAARILPIAKEILAKSPALSTNSVAELVVERLNDAVSRATAWRHINKMRKKE
ncbi:MAG: hypothetical protein RIE84_07660 [Parvibaculum sp.]|uniref:hypothetical protein n=1 Tax=Parvibaculum sp. TaxID=2024848 RepID=UPI0032EE4B5B